MSRPILPNRRKHRRVPINRLTHLPFHRVQLHAALDFESILSRLTSIGIGRDTDHDAPRAILGYAVVDDLVTGESCVSVKCLSSELSITAESHERATHLGRRLLTFHHLPMVHFPVRHQTQSRIGDPGPERHIVVH